MGLLTSNILSNAVYLINKGNLNLVFSLGWSIDSIKGLQQLSSDELLRLAEKAPNLLRPQCIDNSAFHQAFLAIKHESDELKLQDDLLRYGAPASLMHELFGWTTNQTTTRRRLLGLPPQNGRPAQATENKAVYQQWLDTRNETDLRQRLLRIAKNTGLPIRNFAQSCIDWANQEAGAQAEPALKQR